MRKVYKKKKSSCAMCKPHKMKWDCRWKVKDKDKLSRFEKLKRKLGL